MEDLSRRTILGLAAAGLTTGILNSRCARGKDWTEKNQKIPVLHITDLFRPHMDPDDHWDLACIYALAHQGDIDLKGVLIDHPPANRTDRNPDITAVAQMNLICNLFVPTGVGSPHSLKSRNDIQPYASGTDHHGVRMIFNILNQSPRPVVINILGSSRDVAIAGKKDPDLFADNCAAIYLNAGTGSPNMGPASKLEYNVTLGKFAYAAIFDLPCPVYWMPCFEEMESRRERSVREYGTHYEFQQDRILPHLTKSVQNYFAYMFGKYTDHNWLHYLKSPGDQALLSKVGGMNRHMWCTAGFFHAAGYTVCSDGKIVPLKEKSDRPVFTFDPIKIKCADNGVTKWTPDDNSKDRFIFHVRDVEHYQSAMTTAMKTLLTTLP
ncbi:hypothetical protein ACFL5Z_08460 [Planctomycetota bacterium]